MALNMIFKAAALALVMSPQLHAADGEALVKGSDCLSCHQVSRKVVGPAYVDVAKKYKNASPAQIKALVAKVKNGGSGVWGAVPMAAHPTLADADIEAMVKWVLSQKGGAAPAAAAPAAAAPAPAPAAEKPAAAADKKAEPKKGKKHHASHLREEPAEDELAFETDDQVRKLMEKQDCYGCHSATRRDGMADENPWPSFTKIENKYKGKPIGALVKKVHAGEGKETWGKVPHPKYEHLPEEAVSKMVAYITEGKATKGVVAVDPNSLSGEEWMRKSSDCFSCHAVNKKVTGPAYLDVAKKYPGASDAVVKTLVSKVKMGGSGNWGNVAMAAHPNATDAQLEKAVRWVLSQK